jgi:gluconate kinase
MRIAVVGTCASGKSTIVAELRRLGYDAFVVSQEHSVVRDLWKHQHPDVVVYLQVDYPTIQARRGESWPRWIYDLQVQRLKNAREYAGISVDTGAQTVAETISRIVAWIEQQPLV